MNSTSDQEQAEADTVIDCLGATVTSFHCIICASFGQRSPYLMGIHGRSPWCSSCGHVYTSMVMRGPHVAVNFSRIK